MDKIVETYDTSLRYAPFGGSQGIGVDERINIINTLDDIGISYIDIGTPDGSEKYARFYQQAGQLTLESSVLTPYLRALDCGHQVGFDPVVERIVALDTRAVCIEGECSEYVIREEGRVRLEENLWRITALISWFRSRGKIVIFNAHNYFDSISSSAAYAREVIKAAQSSGVDRIVLCDSNGYAMFHDITAGIDVVHIQHAKRIGIACGNSAGCADSNAIVAAKSGAMHIQGSFLGTGPMGNISLATTIVNLQVNMGYSCIPYMKLNRLTHAAEYIADQLDVGLPASMPYVGSRAFTQERPIIPNSRSANMIHPEVVGNSRRTNLTSNYALTILVERLNKLGYRITKEQVTALEQWKDGHRGYTTEVSMALKILRALGKLNSLFRIDEVKVLAEKLEQHAYNRVSVVLTCTVDGEQRTTVGTGEDTARALWSAIAAASADKIKNLRSIKLNSLRGRAMGRTECSIIGEVTNGERAWSVSASAPNELGCLCSMYCDVLDYHLLTMGYYRDQK